MQTRTPMILIKEQASFTELVDNQEGIILDLDNLHYYTLNSTGVFLWKWIRSEKQSSVESLSAAMADAFNIGSDLAELDASSFLDDLSGNGLITFTDATIDAAPADSSSPRNSVCLPAYETPHLKLSNALTQVTLSGSSTIATAAIATGGGL